MKSKLLAAAILTLCLCSCGLLDIKKKPEEKDKKASPFGPSGIPPQLRRKGSTPEAPADPGIAVAPGGNATPGSTGKPIPGLTPREDIVYTDPDHPEAGLPQLADLLEAPKRGPWEESETIAKQRSAREGKPLLIWFTDTRNSPMCQALSQELFSTYDFGNWATEKLVRLRVDSYVKVENSDLSIGKTADMEARIGGYNSELKKRYKVLGYPTLIMLNSSGEVVGTYRGYKRGGSAFLWGQLKQAEAASLANYQIWRKGLENKGYREWKDRKDRKVFARLTTYSKGTLIFIEPDGTRSRTEESNLSDTDRSWISDQKKLRHLE